MKMRLDCADRNVERLGERLVLHALEIMCRDKQPVILRKLREGFVESVPQFQVGKRRIVASRFAYGRSCRRRGPSAAILRAHVGDNPEDPGRKTGLTAEIRQ